MTITLAIWSFVVLGATAWAGGKAQAAREGSDLRRDWNIAGCIIFLFGALGTNAFL